MFGAVIVAIATSPIGRLSGAHLNPVVTLAFWITGHVHPHDLFGYWAAQLAGGVLAAARTAHRLGRDGAAGIHYGAIIPEVARSRGGHRGGDGGLLICAMFLFLSEHALVRWTPVAAGLVVAVDTWLGAPS